MQQGLELTQPIKFVYYDTHNIEHQKGIMNVVCILFFNITMLTNKINNKKFKNAKQNRLFYGS